MLRLWNIGVAEFLHVVAAGADPDTERARLVHEFTSFLVHHLMKVDSHPTLSRFFTFRDCIDRMLTMSVIRFPENAFILKTVKPRQENQKRLRRVSQFFAHVEAPQLLRRASLVLQLVGAVEAVASSKPNDGELPLAVSLAKGDWHDLVVERLQRLIGSIWKDPALAVGPAFSALLATAVDLILRLNVYRRYPFRMCLLCRRWFPATFLQ